MASYHTVPDDYIFLILYECTRLTRMKGKYKKTKRNVWAVVRHLTRNTKFILDTILLYIKLYLIQFCPPSISSNKLNIHGKYFREKNYCSPLQETLTLHFDKNSEHLSYTTHPEVWIFI